MMINNQTFLPAAAVECIDAGAADPGSLVFMPTKSLRRYALIGIGDGGHRYLMDLGAERPFGVWVDERDLGSAILILDWRLEVDPSSATAETFGSLRLGHAYTVNGEAGLIGLIQPHQRTKVAMGTAGTVEAGGRAVDHRAFYSRWRIVTGPVDCLTMLVDSSSLSVPSSDE